MKKGFIIFLVGVVAGAWISHQSAKVVKKETKVEIVEDKTQIKETKTIVEKIKPDGTIIRKIVQNKDTKVDVKKDKAEAKVEIVDRSRDWYVGAMAGTTFSTPTPVFGAEVHRRILGPFSAGIFLLTNKTAGVTLGLSL